MICKSPIACVVRGNSHNCTCSITGQNIIANPNWNFFIREWIYRVCARELARDALHISHALALATIFCVGNIFFNDIFSIRSGNDFHVFMLGSKGHVSNSEDRIWAGCENFHE